MKARRRVRRWRPFTAHERESVTVACCAARDRPQKATKLSVQVIDDAAAAASAAPAPAAAASAPTDASAAVAADADTDAADGGAGDDGSSPAAKRPKRNEAKQAARNARRQAAKAK